MRRGEGKRGGGGGSLGAGGGERRRGWMMKLTRMTFPSIWPSCMKSMAFCASPCSSYSTCANPLGRFTALSMASSTFFSLPYVEKISFKCSSVTLRVKFPTTKRVAPPSFSLAFAPFSLLLLASRISTSPPSDGLRLSTACCFSLGGGGEGEREEGLLDLLELPDEEELEELLEEEELDGEEERAIVRVGRWRRSSA